MYTKGIPSQPPGLQYAHALATVAFAISAVLATGTVNGALARSAKFIDEKSRIAKTRIQQRIIEGTVVDEKDMPMPGVSIVVKGTTIGTTSDEYGKYSIAVADEEAILVFTFVGFIPQEVTVGEKARIRIAMVLDVQFLKEIVVVGYGQQKLESVTGSISKISTDEIVQSKTANLANGLAGRVPGLMINTRGGEPGVENVDILIRGKGTFGNTMPLYVVDGVANRGSFERLNPNDIESISVLKDASAAIYGAQAANGVILITTKRGKTGAPTMSYSNAFSITQPARRQHLMDAVQYLTWKDEANRRNGRPQLYQSVIADYADGTINKERWTNTDWWEEAIDQWSPQQQHNLNLSGGSAETQYFISGQYLDQDAIYKGRAFGYTQSNVRSNVDVKIARILKVGVDLAARFEDRYGTGASNSSTEDVIRSIYGMAPFEAPYYSNGLVRKTSTGNIIPRITGKAGGSRTLNQIFNNKLTLDLSLDSVTQGLSLTGFGAIDLINRARKDLFKPYDIYFLDADGIYQNLKSTTGTTSLFQQFDREISSTYHLRINYTRTFGQHTFSGFVAYEQNQLTGEYISASRRDLISPDLPYLFTGSQLNKDNDGRGWQSARQNYFGRFNYEYAGQYLLEVTVRRDGSQNFGAGRRFGTFPGVSAGWRVSEANFYSNNNFFDDVKVRASWGRMGNDRVSNFQYYQVYNVVEGAVFGDTPTKSVGLVPGTTPNPAITWESSQKWNVGIDLSAPNGMLDIVVDVFKEQRSDILTKRSASVPVYAGIVLPDENIGKTENQGFEVSLSHRRKLLYGVGYRAGAQVTYAKNKIVFMDESPFIPGWQKAEGAPIDRLLIYKAEGIYQSQEEIDETAHFPDAKPGDVRFADINSDNKIDADDRIILPQGPTPRIMYSFSFGVSWKGIEISAFLQGQAQASTIYRPWDINQDSWYSDNRWISATETPNAKSPAPWDLSSSTFQSVSTIWVKKNDFLRLKNLEVAYSLPQSILTKLHVTNLRLSASAYNLGFIYDKIKLYDPESTSTTGWYYPQQRIITAGLSLSF